MKRKTVTMLVSIGALLLVIAAATLVFLLRPELIGLDAGRVADGATPVAVGGSGYTITPEAEWWVQAAPSSFIAGPEEHVIRSPDGVLEVRISAPAAEFAENALGETERTAGAEAGEEVLASGLAVRHVSTEDTLTAVVETPEGPILLLATVSDRAGSAAGADEQPLDPYRWSIAQLLATLAGPGIVFGPDGVTSDAGARLG